MAFEAQYYGPVFSALLNERRLNGLDGDKENGTALDSLKSLTVERAFDGKTIIDPEMADACVSGAWLYHNFLDQSHTISQSIHSATGSFWHGIMHRREPDFSNSKHWFRKVGEHAVFDAIREAACETAAVGGSDSAFLRDQAAWDPYAFVDLVEACLGGQSDADGICREIQQREFELLFDYSYRKSVE
jgi:hypothetical protein